MGWLELRQILSTLRSLDSSRVNSMLKSLQSHGLNKNRSLQSGWHQHRSPRHQISWVVSNWNSAHRVDSKTELCPLRDDIAGNTSAVSVGVACTSASTWHSVQLISFCHANWCWPMCQWFGPKSQKLSGPSSTSNVQMLRPDPPFCLHHNPTSRLKSLRHFACLELVNTRENTKFVKHEKSSPTGARSWFASLLQENSTHVITTFNLWIILIYGSMEEWWRCFRDNKQNRKAKRRIKRHFNLDLIVFISRKSETRNLSPKQLSFECQLDGFTGSKDKASLTDNYYIANWNNHSSWTFFSMGSHNLDSSAS